VADEQEPFEDVRLTADGFSLPELKWRELVFVGALRRDGDVYVRDPARPLPPFRRDGLFPDGQRFTVSRSGRRVLLRRR
jgi:hypothetical protein